MIEICRFRDGHFDETIFNCTETRKGCRNDGQKFPVVLVKWNFRCANGFTRICILVLRRPSFINIPEKCLAALFVRTARNNIISMWKWLFIELGARLYPFILFLTCGQSETGEYAIIRLFDIARIYHMTRGMDCVRNHQLAPRGASPCAVIDLMHPFNDAKYLECKNVEVAFH